MLAGIGKLRIAGLMIASVIFIRPVTGQRPSNPPGGGGSLPSPNRTTPSTPPGQNPSQSSPDSLHIYLSGKVILEDGSPLPQPVTIERVCNGSPRAQAYTDMKGVFSFQMGQNQGVLQDAAEEGTNFPGTPRAAANAAGVVAPSTGPGSTSLASQLSGCVLRGLLPGYRSDLVDLGGRHALDDPNIGTIVLHRLGNVEGTVISVTSLQAPRNAQRAYDKARQDLQKHKLSDAAKNYQKAVDIYPQYAAAWYELGWIHQRQHETDQAHACYAKALAADPKFLAPYAQLAQLAVDAHNWREAAETTDSLLKLDPVDFPLAYLFNAIANLNLSNLDAAEKSARAGAKLDGLNKYPKREEVLAMVLARKKDYAGAAEHMRSYLQLAPEADDAPQIKRQLADLERVSARNQRPASGTQQ